MRAAAACLLLLAVAMLPPASAQGGLGLSGFGIAMVGFRSITYDPDTRTLTAELVLVVPSNLTLEPEDLRTIKFVGAGTAVGQEIRLRARWTGENTTEYVSTIVPLRISLDPHTETGRFTFMIYINGSPVAHLDLDLQRLMEARGCALPTLPSLLQDRRALSALLLVGAGGATAAYYAYRRWRSRGAEESGEEQKSSASV